MKDVHVTSRTFPAGVCEEYNVRRILFDIVGFREEFGPGNPLLLIQRPGEEQSYPVTPEVEGDYAVWIPQQQDTDIPGTIKVVLQWYTEDGLAISTDYYARISGTKSSAGEVPEPEERWYRDVLQAGEDAKSCAAEARQALNELKEGIAGGSGGSAGGSIAIDATLTVSGAAADAKETGDRLSALSDGIENLGSGQTGSLSYRLNGKTVVFFGDSICAGTTSSGGYAELIGSMTGCIVINKGVSGATIANAGTSTTKIVDVVKQYEGDADYFCIEGFANDCNQGIPLGTVTSGYNDTLDETTFAGALESICQSLLSHTTAKVVAVVTHNCTMPDTQNADTGLTLRSYHDTAMEIYQKYGIKVYDAFLESGLNTGYSSSTSLPAFAKALADTYTVDGDKVHPNQQGYEKYYVRQIIDVLSDGDIYDIVNSSESPSTPVTYECDFSITGFVRNNGTISTAAGSGTYGHRRTDYIPMDGVTSITLNVGGYSSAYYISFFDSSKTCITLLSRTISDNYGDVSETIEIDSSYSGAAYFVISHYNMAGYTGDFEPTASYVAEG